MGNIQELENVNWHGLRNQITRLAVYSVSIFPMWMIYGIAFLLSGFSGVATGWLVMVVFTVGQEGWAYYFWVGASYLVGFVIALLVFLNVVYSDLESINLMGEAKPEGLSIDTKKIVVICFGIFASVSTIVANSMFTYSKISVIEVANANQESAKADMIIDHKNNMLKSEREFEKMREYWISLDFDNDKSNDAWARKNLDSLLAERKIQVAAENRLLNDLQSMPESIETGKMKAEGQAFALIKDIGTTTRPPGWDYKKLLIWISVLIALCIEGGIRLTGHIISKKKAYDNVSTVFTEVNELIVNLSRAYAGLGAVQSVKFSEFTKQTVNNDATERKVGEGINWDSPSILKLLRDIEDHWRENGGDLTFEQIGERNECGKSYVSQVFNAAVAKGLIIDPRNM